MGAMLLLFASAASRQSNQDADFARPQHQRAPCAAGAAVAEHKINVESRKASRCLSATSRHPTLPNSWHMPSGKPLVGVATLSQVLSGANTSATPWGHMLSGATNARPPLGFATKPRHSCIPCVRRRVEKNMHFIWMGSRLPAKYARNIANMDELNAAWTVHLWIDHSLGATAIATAVRRGWEVMNISEHASHFRNWDLVVREHNLAGKSDYLRLEVVYRYGGVYVDTDTVGLRSYDSGGELFAWPFVVYDGGGYRNICNGYFGFEARSAFLDYAIDLARENCLTHHNCGVMAGVGPGFLSRAILEYGDDQLTLIHSQYIIHKSQQAFTYSTMDATWLDAKNLQRVQSAI